MTEIKTDRITIYFGKYKGKKLNALPDEYLAWLYKDWERIREAAGLEDVRLHDLRRTFASWLIEYEGQSMDLIGGILRHADTRTTKRYAHLGDKRKQSAVDGLAGRLLK